MLDYRVYLLDASDRIFAYHAVTCESDEEAVALATDLLGDKPGIEVWHRGRLVHRLLKAQKPQR